MQHGGHPSSHLECEKEKEGNRKCLYKFIWEDEKLNPRQSNKEKEAQRASKATTKWVVVTKGIEKYIEVWGSPYQHSPQYFLRASGQLVEGRGFIGTWEGI